MPKWQCLIHKGTHETFIWSIMWKILSFLGVWKCLFLIIPVWFHAQVTFVENPEWKINSFQNYKHSHLIHTWSGKAFKGTIVNRALPSLHDGSLEIIYRETLNNEYIKRIHQMSYSSLPDNGMLQIFSFLIKWLYGTL